MKKLQPKNPRNFTEVEIRLGFVFSTLTNLSDDYVPGMNCYMDGWETRVPHTLKDADNNAALNEFLCSAMLARQALEVCSDARLRVNLSVRRHLEKLYGHKITFRTPADRPNGGVELSTLPHVESSIPTADQIGVTMKGCR